MRRNIYVKIYVVLRDPAETPTRNSDDHRRVRARRKTDCGWAVWTLALALTVRRVWPGIFEQSVQQTPPWQMRAQILADAGSCDTTMSAAAAVAVRAILSMAVSWMIRGLLEECQSDITSTLGA